MINGLIVQVDLGRGGTCPDNAHLHSGSIQSELTGVRNENSCAGTFAGSRRTIALGGTPFTGTVKDSSNTPISGAMVLIHSDSAGTTVGPTTNIGIKEDLVIRAKADGSFNVDLPPGFYDVFVAAMAFSPTCRKIRINQGQSIKVALHLNADPLYTAEMGDRLETIPHKH